MEGLRVELGERSYDIRIGQNTLDALGGAVKELKASPTLALVSNPTIYALYGERVHASLTAAGFDVVEIIVPDGEEHKELLWVERILTSMLERRLDRKSLLVALGGGVIGDVAGFAASLYMRGIRFVQVPTTLLAQVDSSVGGKTGVNHPLGKNMIGTFWQPSLVWIDVDTLKTLPQREFLCGMAEVIKYGVIWDRELFDYLGREKNKILSLDPETISHIIRRSCEIKAEVVSRDEREGGLRAILNYGHTIGHAIETVTGYIRYLHGEGVSMGMYLEAALSERLGIMKSGGADEVKRLIDDYGLPSGLFDGADATAMVDAMGLDKKTVAGTIRCVLPESVGKVLVNEPVTREALMELLASL